MSKTELAFAVLVLLGIAFGALSVRSFRRERAGRRLTKGRPPPPDR